MGYLFLTSSPMKWKMGRVEMKVVVGVLVLAFCSTTEGRSSIDRGEGGGSGGGDSDGGGSGVYIQPFKQNTKHCNTFNTTTINTTTLGTIHSPFTPSIIKCQWEIGNPKRQKLVFRFTKLNLKYCQSDLNQCCFQWLEMNLPSPNHWTENDNPDFTPEHPSGLSRHGGDSVRGGVGDVAGMGRVCGAFPPPPSVTEAPHVYISYYSLPELTFPPVSIAVGGSGDIGFVLEFYSVKNSTLCGRDEYACLSPRLCLPRAWLCDGAKHCPDNSDEHTCQEELVKEQEERHRKKRKKKKRRRKKLREEEEEEEELKNEIKIVSMDGECLQEATTIHCDGAWQCPEGEDEKGCPGCQPDEWWCGLEQQCYTADQRCDGIRHCINAMDEQSCDPKCPRRLSCWGWGECYMLSQRCDGLPDCLDASDEADCSPDLCNEHHGTFLCDNRRCVRESWLCDQRDDCRDGSDEQDCLRNSVIGVAAMGGLACSLLLVVAVGCTGRLYALRMGLTRLQGTVSRGRGGSSGARGSGGEAGGSSGSSRAPRSRLEEHLMQREMPPSYDVAVSDHSSPLFGTFMDWQQRRRQRRRSSVPRDSANNPGRLPPADPHNPHLHQHSTSSTPGLAVEIQPGRGRREGEEKVEDRVAGEENDDPFVFSVPEGDVPLLTDLGGGEEEEEMGDDVPLLLDVTSTSTSTSASIFDEDSDEEEGEVGSDGENEEDEEEEEEEEEEEGDKGVGRAITLPLLPDLLHLTPQAKTGQGDTEVGMRHGEEVMGRKEEEHTHPSPTSPFTHNTEIKIENEHGHSNLSSSSSSPSSSFPTEDAGGDGGGDALSSETRAAVLALSAVQTHMDEMSHSDTEMICQ